MAITTFAALIAQPATKKTVLCEVTVGQQLIQKNWTNTSGNIWQIAYGTYSGSLPSGRTYTVVQDVSAVGAAGLQYAAQTSLVNCEATALSFYYDGSATLYVNFNGKNPNTDSTLGPIIAYFPLRFSTNVGTNLTPTGISGQRYYDPFIKEVPTISQSTSQMTGGFSTVSVSSIVLSNEDGFFDGLATAFIWQNQRIKILFGGESLPYSEYQTEFSGRVTDVSWSPRDFTLTLQSLNQILAQAMIPPPANIFTLANYPKADPALIGTYKPILYGTVAPLQPTEVPAHSAIYPNATDEQTYNQPIYSGILTGYATGNGPIDLDVSTVNGNYMYVANQTDGTVTVVSPATGNVIATVTVGTSPVAVCFNPSNGYIYVANSGSNNVSVIDTATNTVTATVAVQNNPVALAYDSTNNRIWCACNQGVPAKISVISGTSVVTTITLNDVGVASNATLSLAFSPATGKMYVVDQYINFPYGNPPNSPWIYIQVEPVNASTYAVGAAIIPVGPTAAFSSYGTQSSKAVYCPTDKKIYFSVYIQRGWQPSQVFDPATNTFMSLATWGSASLTGVPTYNSANGYMLFPNGTGVSSYSPTSKNVVGTTTYPAPVGAGVYAPTQAVLGFLGTNTNDIYLPSSVVSYNNSVVLYNGSWGDFNGGSGTPTVRISYDSGVTWITASLDGGGPFTPTSYVSVSAPNCFRFVRNTPGSPGYDSTKPPCLLAIRFNANSYIPAQGTRARVALEFTGDNLTSASDIIKDILINYTGGLILGSDIDNASFASAKLNSKLQMTVFLNQPQTVQSVIDKLCQSDFGFFYVNNAGQFAYKIWGGNLSTVALDDAQLMRDQLRVDYYVNQQYTSVTVGYNKGNNSLNGGMLYASQPATGWDLLASSVYGVEAMQTVETYLNNQYDAIWLASQRLMFLRFPMGNIRGQCKWQLGLSNLGDIILLTTKRAPYPTGGLNGTYIELISIQREVATGTTTFVGRTMPAGVGLVTPGGVGLLASDTAPGYGAASVIQRLASGYYTDDAGNSSNGDVSTANTSLFV